ncbi:MAG: M18 family aminopeptidase [Desulfobacterales bacterium]|nr:MAG: M18 family aminopeptidase [Desulfobacterales bacterium]
MNYSEFNNRLFSFIDQSPTPFHAIKNTSISLEDQGFLHLRENETWNLEQGKRYFVSRSGSLIAFSLGSETGCHDGFRIIGTHSDSPALKIKPHVKKENGYITLGVETYGSPVLAGWFDRPLSLAGNIVILNKENRLEEVLVDFRKPLLYIPSLAIHLNRTANDGITINVQNQLSPILTQSLDNPQESFFRRLYEMINSSSPDKPFANISSFDLYCYDPAKSALWGLDQEFINAPRLDNLLSCFVGREAIKNCPDTVNGLLICSNHEEVGSRSESGALGSFASDIFKRIYKDAETRAICLNNSFLLSLDNAHAHHPLYPEKSDAAHEVQLNGGPVIKLNANQRYATSAKTAAIIRCLGSEAGIDIQDFVMRSDMACGSTIGPLTSSRLGIAAADVGAPTWGMHAIREVTGTRDPGDLYTLVHHFVNRKTLFS